MSARIAWPSLRLVANLAANYAYILAMALITLFVVPLYVHRLGAEQWGIVALCLTIQGLLFALDMALGPVMLRDVARAAANGQLSAVYRRYLRWYALPALVLFVLGQVVLSVVADQRSLSAAPLSAELVWAIRLSLVQFLFQFANNAAIGFWNGQQRQAFASGRLAAFTLIKHAAALWALSAIAASAVYYMLPFAIIGAIEFAVNLRRVHTERTGAVDVREDVALAGDWRDIAGYAGATALGIATAQIDRAYLSATLPTASYGVYLLASSLMLSLFSLQMPVQRAFLPRMAVSRSPREVAAAMRKLVLVILVLPCLAMAAFPEWVLQLWLHDRAIAAAAAPTLRLLLLAVAMNAWYAPSAMLLLHAHRNGLMATINAAILIVQFAVLLGLTPRVGMLAGGISWLACAGIQLLVAAWLHWHLAGDGESENSEIPLEKRQFD